MASREDRAYARQALRRLMVLVALLALAIGLTAVGAYLAYVKADLALRGEVVWGEVVAVEPDVAGTTVADVIVVAFKPAGRRTVTIRHSETSRPTGLGVGAKVPVNFLPEAPEEARILGRINWIPPVLLLLLGPTLVVLAIRGIRIEGQRAVGGGGGDDFPA